MKMYLVDDWLAEEKTLYASEKDAHFACALALAKSVIDECKDPAKLAEYFEYYRTYGVGLYGSPYMEEFDVVERM